MEFEFSCECGHDISEFTRNESSETSIQVPCEECGAVYAVTISQIRPGDDSLTVDASRSD